jgi:hypothetical protein
MTPSSGLIKALLREASSHLTTAILDLAFRFAPGCTQAVRRSSWSGFTIVMLAPLIVIH